MYVQFCVPSIMLYVFALYATLKSCMGIALGLHVAGDEAITVVYMCMHMYMYMYMYLL